MWIWNKDSRRINYRMLMHVLGWLLLVESAFMAVPTLVAACSGESDWKILAIAAAVTLLSGGLLTHGPSPERKSMDKREGVLLTAMVWIVFSIFGMIPLMWCSTPLDFTDAFLEAMAGFTTTGISIYEDVDSISRGINLWRAMMQWIGGVGIILFTLAVIPMLNSSGGMQMFNAEVTGITHDKIKPRISQTALVLWLVYAALTVACAVCLWAGPMSFFDSVCHALGTVSTGGFSTRQMGVCDWDSSYIYLVITLFMFLGGASMSLIYFVACKNIGVVRRNVVFRGYCLVILASTAIFIASIVANDAVGSWEDVSIYPLFQVVSTITSTGYTISSLPLWGPVTIALMIVLMTFGGCAGSTSGGMKIDRVIVLHKFVINSIKRVLKPNNITAVKIDGNVLAPDVVLKVVAFICIYFIIVCMGGIILAAMDVPVVDSFFCSLSCMTNLGIGADVAAFGQGVEAVPILGRWVLAALMLIGRLEIFTILMLFTPMFWQK